jgi:hypothetical protein
MSRVFVIEDERHAEDNGRFASFDAAVSELKRRAELPWDEPPNQAPCTSWRGCGREYLIYEYDDSIVPWTLVRKEPVLEVSASGVTWSPGFENVGPGRAERVD